MSIARGVSTSDAAIDSGTIDGATVGVTTPAAGKFTTLQSTGLTTAASATVTGTATLQGALAHTGTTLGFYGKAASAQRTYSSAVHASSAASVSASFGATQLAILQELQDTMIALGIWATA